MRCPQCKFVSSNKRDICPRCNLDLRPHKQVLGLPVSNSTATAESLRLQENQNPVRTPTPVMLPVVTEAMLFPAAKQAAETAPKSAVAWFTKFLKKKAPLEEVVKPIVEAANSDASITPVISFEPLDQAVTGIEDVPRVGRPFPGLTQAESISESLIKNEIFSFDTIKDETNGVSADEKVADKVIERIKDLESPAKVFELSEDDAASGFEIPELVTPAPISAPVPVSASSELLFGQRLELQTAAPAELSTASASDVSENLFQFEPAKTPEEDAIDAYSTVLEKGVVGATVAASLLREQEFKTETGTGTDKVHKAPVVNPTVVEFNEGDDDLLEKQLDEMIGDLILDVEAVKVPEKAQSKPLTGVITEDDLEITFEVEHEEENAPLVAQSEPESSPETHEDFFDGLVQAFNNMEAGSQQVSLTPQTETPSPTARPIAPPHTPAAPVRAKAGNKAERIKTLLKKKSELGSADVSTEEKDKVINELLDLLAEAYDIESEDSQLGDTLHLLQQELDAELNQLMSEGTSFFKTEDSIPEVPVAVSPLPEATTTPVLVSEAVDPQAEAIQRLADTLSDELKALEAEGLSVYSTNERAPEEAPEDSTPVTRLSETCATSSFLVNDLVGALADLEATESENLEAEEESPVTASVLDSASEELVFPPLKDALATGVFLREDLEKIFAEHLGPDTSQEEETETEDNDSDHGLFVGGTSHPPIVEGPSEGDGQAITSVAGTDPVVDGWWKRVDEDISGLSDEDEIEIESDEFACIQPSDRYNLLFDMVDDELLNPGKKIPERNELPSSAKARVDNSSLQQALSRFKKDLADKKAARQMEGKAPVIVLPEIAPAPRWRRSLAWFVDILTSVGLGAIFSLLAVFPPSVRENLLGRSPIDMYDILPHVFGFAATCFIAWIVLSSLLVYGRGQTVGQGLLKIRVTDEQKKVPGLAQSVLWTLSQITTALSCGFGLVSFVGKSKRPLHDYMAKTFVTIADEPA